MLTDCITVDPTVSSLMRLVYVTANVKTLFNGFKGLLAKPL